MKDLLIFYIFDHFKINYFNHFKSNYLIGKWEDGLDVVVSNKVIINVLKKHYIDEKRKSFKFNDIYDISNMLNYSYLFKDEKYPNSSNLNFFTKSSKRNGYYDCLMTKIGNKYYVFHFMYIRNKNFKNELKRKINMQLAIKINE